MSRAPIWSGIRKFPNPLIASETTKKTMIVPCIVKNAA